MARPSIYTPEEAAERTRARVLLSVKKHAERLKNLSPLEQAAWKARATLGADFDPYTPEERERLEYIRKVRRALEAETDRLNAKISNRLRAAVVDNPGLAALLGELANGKEVRVSLKPH